MIFWNIFKTYKELCIEDLYFELGISCTAVQEHFSALETAGYIEKTGVSKINSRHYHDLALMSGTFINPLSNRVVWQKVMRFVNFYFHMASKK